MVPRARQGGFSGVSHLCLNLGDYRCFGVSLISLLAAESSPTGRNDFSVRIQYAATPVVPEVQRSVWSRLLISPGLVDESWFWSRIDYRTVRIAHVWGVDFSLIFICAQSVSEFLWDRLRASIQFPVMPKRAQHARFSGENGWSPVHNLGSHRGISSAVKISE
eukprot:COSAG02_NODE_1333_length_13206_cov_221.257801_7_plen_163_part_00